MLTLTDAELAKKLRALRFHGLEKQAWNRYAEGGTPQVEIVLPGFKYNFMDIQAALGIHQLASVDEFNARRDRARRALPRAVSPRCRRSAGPAAPAYDHVPHLAPLRDQGARRGRRSRATRFMAALRARNVGTGLHFRAVHTQPYYRDKYPGRRGRCRNPSGSRTASARSRCSRT